MHWHRCDNCGTTWAHEEDSFGNPVAHSCPRCLEIQWLVGGFIGPCPHQPHPVFRLLYRLGI